MTRSNTLTAYGDCIVLFEKAMGSPKGIQVALATSQEAQVLRHRLNKARTLEREQNKRIYADQPDHFLYDSSEFYAITVKIIFSEDRDLWLVRLEKLQFAENVIEEIPGDDGPIAVLPWEETTTEVVTQEQDDEFDLGGEPEGDLASSPGGAKGSRRF